MGSEWDALLELAAAISDGAGVDWGDVEGKASGPDERRVVEQLRLIAMIAGMHRSRDDPPDPAVNSGGVDADARELTTGHAAGNLERWGELILIEEVGQGSFGIVYRAHDPHLDRPVAVKLLRRNSSTDEQLASRLLDEGRALARVRHPNVVMVHGSGEHEGRVGFWMEFVRGLTLEQMLVSHGAFGAGEAGLIGYELCGALAAVHKENFVHRDIKAQNVMREEGGRLVLMDFGAGQRRAEPGTVATRVIGTPLYLAPEVLMGMEGTFRSDIYSLGVLLYHLVTNDFPVKANTLSDLVLAHARREITPLQDVRPDLQSTFVRIVERATDPDPARRFASAGLMGAALARIRGSHVNAWAPRLRTSKPKTDRTALLARGRDTGVKSVAVLPFTDMSPAK